MERGNICKKKTYAKKQTIQKRNYMKKSLYGEETMKKSDYIGKKQYIKKTIKKKDHMQRVLQENGTTCQKQTI